MEIIFFAEWIIYAALTILIGAAGKKWRKASVGAWRAAAAISALGAGLAFYFKLPAAHNGFIIALALISFVFNAAGFANLRLPPLRAPRLLEGFDI